MHYYRLSWPIVFFTLALTIFPLFSKASEIFYISDLSHIGFSIYHRKISKMVKGEFLSFQGRAEFVPELKRLKSAYLEIDPSSISTSDPERDQTLKEHKQFFDFLNFKKIIFQIPHPIKFVQNKGVEATGFLSIKGLERPILLTITYLGKKSAGHSFKITSRLSRKDFAIDWNQRLASGVWELSDEVHIYAEAIILKPGPREMLPPSVFAPQVK